MGKRRQTGKSKGRHQQHKGQKHRGNCVGCDTKMTYWDTIPPKCINCTIWKK